MSNRSSCFRDTRVLLLSAHTDDCELGMGATIARMVRDGAVIQWLVFSNAVESLPDGFGPQTLLDEQRNAAKVYGMPEDCVKFYDFPVRRFPEFRQEILDILIQTRNKYSPELVFCASRADCHQDHETLTREAFRAFKGRTLLGYHLPWNSTSDHRQLAIEVSEADAKQRVDAIKAYRSQSHRPYFNRSNGYLVNEFYGGITGLQFAEVFEVISMKLPLGSVEL